MTEGAARPSRSRDPRNVHLRRRRELDKISAQLTALRKRPARHAGWIDDDTWGHRARAAYENGAQSVRPGVIEWDASGRCETPVFRTLKAMPTDYWGNALPRDNQNPTRYLDIWVRCRKCRPCLRAKSWHWKKRAEAEVALSNMVGARTWFVTLTFNALYRSRILMAAQRDLAKEGQAAEFSEAQRRSALAKAAQPYVTLWMKRLRAQTGAGLRYLQVTEAHKDGMPHCHLLVHESSPDMPVRHAVLSRQWHYGFSNAKLIDSDDPHAAEYVTKYVSKSPDTRVRASVGYGQTGG